jgi:DNA repair exonuclease SbcCD nuclease subunit
VRKIIHAADLHIADGEEKPYCYGVLDEIIALALAEKAGALVIAGDLFDSFGDFEALRSEVCAKLKPLAEAGCPTIYIPGNHDGRGAAADLAAYNLDPVIFSATRPFALVEAGGMEFLCVPHSDSYEGYRDWKVPARKPGLPRIVVAHALNPAIYTGPDEETDAAAGVMDDDLFARFGADYAALGHVHAGRQQGLGGAVACYPGSARVWRAHPREAGPRRVCVVELGEATNVRTAELASAGLYKEYRLPLNLEGEVNPAAADKIAAETGKLDLVKVTLTGVVENENAARASAEALAARLGEKARRAVVVSDTIVAADISSNSLTRAFLAEIDKLEPDDAQSKEYRRWLLARQYGLQELASKLVEGR